MQKQGIELDVDGMVNEYRVMMLLACFEFAGLPVQEAEAVQSERVQALQELDPSQSKH